MSSPTKQNMLSSPATIPASAIPRPAISPPLLRISWRPSKPKMMAMVPRMGPRPTQMSPSTPTKSAHVAYWLTGGVDVGSLSPGLPNPGRAASTDCGTGEAPGSAAWESGTWASSPVCTAQQYSASGGESSPAVESGVVPASPFRPAVEPGGGPARAPERNPRVAPCFPSVIASR